LANQIKPIVKKVEDITSKLDSETLAEDIQESVKQAREILERVNRLTAAAEQGDGALAALLNDPETAGDLKDAVKEFKLLAYNLRKKGILFYKDISGEEKGKSK
jgi:ferritin